jgi:hypothetical protein
MMITWLYMLRNGLRLRWRNNRLRRQFPPGTFVNCCGTKAAIVTGMDDYDGLEYWDIEHNRWGTCSAVHCGPEKITQEEAEEIVRA